MNNRSDSSTANSTREMLEKIHSAEQKIETLQSDKNKAVDANYQKAFTVPKQAALVSAPIVTTGTGAGLGANFSCLEVSAYGSASAGNAVFFGSLGCLVGFFCCVTYMWSAKEKENKIIKQYDDEILSQQQQLNLFNKSINDRLIQRQIEEESKQGPHGQSMEQSLRQPLLSKSVYPSL